MTKILTSGSPAKLIALFTLPLLIGNVFQQFYTIADTYVVGQMLGVDSLAAVGCTGGISFLLVGFAWGMTSGLAIPTARHFGAGDMRAMRRSVTQGAVLSAGLAIVLTAIAVLSAGPLLHLLRTPAELLPEATAFITIIYWGIGANILFNFLSATIRALGDSRTPLYFLAGACVLNVVLVYLFVGTFHMGVAGAAFATVCSQLASGLACLAFIAKKIPALHLSRADWSLDLAQLREHVRIGLPMGFQSSIIAIGSITVQFALNGLGPTAVAAYTAAARIDGVTMAPLASIGVAMATFSAQNLGAREFARIRRGLAQASLISVGFALAMGAVLILLGEHLVAWFVGPSERAVIADAHIYLVYAGALYVSLALLFLLRGALQGLGHSLVPTLAGVMELVGRVVAAVVLGSAFGFAGVCFASPLAWVFACVPLVLAWLRERRRLMACERELVGHDVQRADTALLPAGASLPAAESQQDLEPSRRTVPQRRAAGVTQDDGSYATAASYASID